MKNHHHFLIFFLLICHDFFSLTLSLPSSTPSTPSSSSPEEISCDVFIAGGSIAALAAALSSASMGAKTCLSEPTDWVGGQLTNEALSAVDFAWASVTTGNTTLNIPKIERDPRNLPANFVQLVSSLGDPGQCSVSIACFPLSAVRQRIQALLDAASPFLTVYYNTVPIALNTKTTSATDTNTTSTQSIAISSLDAIQRTPSEDPAFCGGWDVPLSQQIQDWYTSTPSKRFPSKNLLRFSAPVFVEASSWGEILALSGVQTLLGLSEQFDGDVSGQGDDQCGQSSTFDFVQTLSPLPRNDIVFSPRVPQAISSHYGLSTFSWGYVWRYRRVLAAGPAEAQTGDFTIQNWGYGNDNKFAYLFLPRAVAAQQASSCWAGGLNATALHIGEVAALGWHAWFRQNASDGEFANRVVMALGEEGAGTCHGLSKLVYLRDSRRAVGLGGWVLSMKDLTGDAGQVVATPFEDRVAIGNYDVDIHPLLGCGYPAYVTAYYPVLPFYVPFRALTHAALRNVVVSGLSIAQSFLANAATRTHPVQWAIGTASGVSAAYQAMQGVGSTEEMWKQHIVPLQKYIRQFQPIDWTVGNITFP